jgi:hypothetical protein
VEPEHDQATPDQVDVSLADGAVEAEVEIIRRGRAFDPRDLVENGDDSAYAKSWPITELTYYQIVKPFDNPYTCLSAR